MIPIFKSMKKKINQIHVKSLVVTNWDNYVCWQDVGKSLRLVITHVYQMTSVCKK